MRVNLISKKKETFTLATSILANNI